MNNLVREYSQKDYEFNRKKELIHDFRYIYWFKEAEKIRLTHEEWNELIELLEKNGKKQTSSHKTIRAEWCYDCVYNIDDKNKNSTSAYVSELDNGKFKYYIYHTLFDEEKLKIERGAGHKGYNTLDEYLREQYNGKGLDFCFGSLPVENEKCWISKCVKSIRYAFYVDEYIINKKIKNVNKADISSAYPSNLCGRMPNAHTAIQVKGRVAASAEYPFAFYTKSGHVAEYDKYDTHDLMNNKWYQKFEQQHKKNCIKRNEEFITFAEVADEDEITVLMKASPYTLNRAIGKMYWVKENGTEKSTRSWYKWMINALIGFMRSEVNNTQHY